MNKTDPCFMTIDQKPGNFLERDPDRTFTVAPQVQLDFSSRVIATFTRMDTYFETGLELYQSARTFIIPKSMKFEKRKRLDDYFLKFAEYGFPVKELTEEPPTPLGMKLEKRGGKDGFMHYKGLQEYIAENTKVEPLAFDKLDYLFRLYLTLITVILFVNLVHYYRDDLNSFKRRIQIYLVQTKHKLTTFIGTCIGFFSKKKLAN